jgi:release factor glutamine methyltransferase
VTKPPPNTSADPSLIAADASLVAQQVTSGGQQVTSGLLRVTSRRLGEAGCASPEYDAVELLAFVLGLTRAEVAGHRAAGTLPALTEHQLAEFDALIARRAEREPLQHLTGVAAFRYVELQVGPGVFVPRPETELLAGWAVEQCRRLDAPIVVDLCTGSGAIAKAIAHEVPHATVYAVELSEDAHGWAARNLAGTGVHLVQGDLADALPELDGRVDVITCNPPYIPIEAWESVETEARDHDPGQALFSGTDGLVVMRVLAQRAAVLLRPGGVVGAEHADAQGESAPALFAATGRYARIRDHLDLAGRPRFLTAQLAR